MAPTRLSRSCLYVRVYYYLLLLLLHAQNAEESSNIYSTPNSNWKVIDSFTSGQVLDMTIVMNAYHWVSLQFMYQHIHMYPCMYV